MFSKGNKGIIKQTCELGYEGGHSAQMLIQKVLKIVIKQSMKICSKMVPDVLMAEFLIFVQ